MNKLFMGLGFKTRKVSSNDTSSVFSKGDIEKSLKMSNLGNIPKGTDGTKGQVGKMVKPINNKVKDLDDIFDPKV